MSRKHASRAVLVSLLALAVAVPFLTRTRAVSAAQFFGAIFTSLNDGTTVNQNVYDARCDVYLNGGPQNTNGPGLPDGTYYFEVTDPSGATLLSTDNAVDRQLIVFNGRIAGNGGIGTHPNGILNTANGSISVQLCPFDPTPNPGGEYKVHLIRQTSDTSIDPDNPKKLIYQPSDDKTDNFKVKEETTTPQSAIGGVKYYDTNRNGKQDPGELGIEGVTIKVTLSDNKMVTTETDENGAWSLVFDQGTSYTVCEVLPNDSPYTQTGPNEGDKTLDEAANANGDRCWEGEVQTTDTSDLNFGNVICTPVINCPQDITTCNTEGLCSARVSYTVPTATDNCEGTPTVVCLPPPGSFGKGTTTVTCTATGANPNNTASCSFKVTVNDCENPSITCPGDQKTCNTPGQCSATVEWKTGASDNCGIRSVACDPESGSTFNIGTTQVTCTATDTSGNTNQCSFNVTVNDCTTGSISGKKFYDANANGLDDDGKVVKDFKIVLTGPVNSTTYTNGSGNYSFMNLPAGKYTVSEVAPGSSWVASSGTPCTFTIACSNSSNDFTCNFGNYCKVPNGGLSKGYWSNKNGQGVITAADLCFLTSLNLKNSNGTDFDPVPAASCPALTAKQISDGKAALAAFLTNATNATNMANMLSAQFAAMILNVRHGVDGAAFDLCSSQTINSLLTAANTSLGLYPITLSGNPQRAPQETMKNCLDALDNNALVVKATPCPFTAPY